MNDNEKKKACLQRGTPALCSNSHVAAALAEDAIIFNGYWVDFSKKSHYNNR